MTNPTPTASADYAVVKLSLGYAVKNAERERISPVLPSEKAAQEWAGRMLSSRGEATRACLCCGSMFDSAGIHERLCPGCGKRAHDAGMVAASADMRRGSPNARKPR